MPAALPGSHAHLALEPFPLDGGRVGMGVALDFASLFAAKREIKAAVMTPRNKFKARANKNKSHPHPNPSPLKGEGLKSVV